MSTAGGAERLRLAIRGKRFPAVGAAPAKPVIANLILEVPQGGFVALFGPSGCGKTATLNLIAGLDTEYDGTIELPPRTRIGYVFQAPRLLPWLTVEDNLRLVLGDAPDREGRIDAWLGEMDLADVRRVFPSRLSLGMARRVALARAFIIHPTLLLMDEPFVSLDEPTAERLRRLLLETLESHPATVMFVTHNLREAIMLADRIALMAPAPTRVLREIEVPLSHEQRLSDSAIDAFRRDLLGRGLPGLKLAG